MAKDLSRATGSSATSVGPRGRFFSLFAHIGDNAEVFAER
jgi:hypothetical protein